MPILPPAPAPEDATNKECLIGILELSARELPHARIQHVKEWAEAGDHLAQWIGLVCAVDDNATPDSNVAMWRAPFTRSIHIWPWKAMWTSTHKIEGRCNPC